MPNLIRTLAWAWIIIVGGLMFVPGGFECIKCGPGLTKVLGVISIVLGIAGLAMDWRARTARG